MILIVLGIEEVPRRHVLYLAEQVFAAYSGLHPPMHPHCYRFRNPHRSIHTAARPRVVEDDDALLSEKQPADEVLTDLPEFS
jgi:hypothetical protein